MDHFSNSVELDEDVYEELRYFMKFLVKMFEAKGEVGGCGSSPGRIRLTSPAV